MAVKFMNAYAFCLIILWTVTGYIIPVTAVNLAFSYTGEVNYGLSSGKFNNCNLLRTDLFLPLVKNSSFEAAFLNILRLGNPVADDLLTFSNIGEESNPGLIAVLGLRYRINKSTLFAGVRNMNEDYFITGVTSFFTNSSCGIYPTISLNYPIANYPLSSLCIDYKFTTGEWAFRSTLYNGIGYNGWRSHDNPFLFRPANDGLFSISELMYTSERAVYSGGIAMHTRVNDTTMQNIDKKSLTWWLYTEQMICKAGKCNITAIAQYSQNTYSHSFCRFFTGFGALCTLPIRNDNTHRIGAIMSVAGFNFDNNKHMTLRIDSAGSDHIQNNKKNEYTAEFSYCYEKSGFAIQPAVHLIKNCKDLQSVFMLRLRYVLECDF